MSCNYGRNCSSFSHTVATEPLWNTFVCLRGGNLWILMWQTPSFEYGCTVSCIVLGYFRSLLFDVGHIGMTVQSLWYLFLITSIRHITIYFTNINKNENLSTVSCNRQTTLTPHYPVLNSTSTRVASEISSWENSLDTSTWFGMGGTTIGKWLRMRHWHCLNLTCGDRWWYTWTLWFHYDIQYVRSICAVPF